MIDTARAVEIVSGILPRIRRFPRSESAQLAILAECGNLLADRCESESQAENFCRGYEQPGEWHSVGAFEQALNALVERIPLRDQQSLAGYAANSIVEPIRCGDKLIGWCGRSYPPELIAEAGNFHGLTLLQQAKYGQRVMEASRVIERAVWAEVMILPPDRRAALESYAREHYQNFVEKDIGESTRSARWAMCLAFEEWRKQCEK